MGGTRPAASLPRPYGPPQSRTRARFPRPLPPPPPTHAPTTAGTPTLPSNDGKKWGTDEVQELVKLVEDGAYLKDRLGLDKASVQVCVCVEGGRRLSRCHSSSVHGLPSHPRTRCPRTPPTHMHPSPPRTLTRPPRAPTQLDWRVLGQHFNRSYESVSYKYRRARG